MINERLLVEQIKMKSMGLVSDKVMAEITRRAPLIARHFDRLPDITVRHRAGYTIEEIELRFERISFHCRDEELSSIIVRHTGDPGAPMHLSMWHGGEQDVIECRRWEESEITKSAAAVAEKPESRARCVNCLRLHDDDSATLCSICRQPLRSPSAKHF